MLRLLLLLQSFPTGAAVALGWGVVFDDPLVRLAFRAPLVCAG